MRVRGRRWTVIDQTLFGDCAALRLDRSGSDASAGQQTLLIPFDRPVSIERTARLAVVRPRRWLDTLRRHAAAAFPGGGLRAIAAGRVDILPYQLEPALAMLRHGVSRLLIADAVGLGKTIQAALIVAELARRESVRVLIVAPAGLLDQWVSELNTRFTLGARIADAAWLERIGRDLPAAVNPWTLPGIFVASLDFLKRPEVLQTLEYVRWDLVVTDEAHGASPATARRAAVDAVASRSSRVILLTATPPAGDANQLSALCAIGDPAGTGDPIVVFQRSKAADSPPPPRRTTLLPVRLTGRERRMHRLLESYTAVVWRDSTGRVDQRARLAAIGTAQARALERGVTVGIRAAAPRPALGTGPRGGGVPAAASARARPGRRHHSR